MTIRFSARADRQVERLAQHYVRLGRENAVQSLTDALTEALAVIGTDHAQLYPAPRPYPELARRGTQWMHQGRYWIAFRAEPRGFVISYVFFDGANIPGRMRKGRR